MTKPRKLNFRDMDGSFVGALVWSDEEPDKKFLILSMEWDANSANGSYTEFWKVRLLCLTTQSIIPVNWYSWQSWPSCTFLLIPRGVLIESAH